MNQEIKSIVKKTAKIAGVTCVALGGAALIASGAALKALTEGGKYLTDAVKKIVKEEPTGEIVEEAAEVPQDTPAAEEEAVMEDVSVVEETI